MKLEPGVQGLRTKPVSKNAARGIGVINVSAWIGTSSEAAGLGIKKESDEGVVATKAGSRHRVVFRHCQRAFRARSQTHRRRADSMYHRIWVATGRDERGELQRDG